jgi:asparagine synthase (glutamine-hydrolysing)
MCGIAGMISTKNPVLESSILKMTNSLIHRGPDGSGVWINDGQTVGLGHRRLSIIDLSDLGSQPMHFQDRYVISFNGEIYNYIEIRQNLIALGCHFESHSDTEVILAAYHQYGEKCLKLFDGMFAFAIWDKIDNSLFLARDRFGEKPLYYARFNHQFLFASEIKALWAAGLPKKVNDRMLFNYFYFKSLYNPDNLSETFYSNVLQLKPAHSMRISASGQVVSDNCYWQIPEDYDPVPINDAEAIEKFALLLRESVRLRLRSDVPVGSSLSGGLDSSVLVSLINEIKGDIVVQKTFSAIFPQFKKDESKYLDILMKSIYAESHKCFPSKDSIESNIDKIILFQDEPFNSLSISAQFEVMQLSKQSGVKVLLDGQGADEYMCGYPGLIDSYLLSLKKNDPAKYRIELNELKTSHSENQINSVKRRILRMHYKQIFGNAMIDRMIFFQKKFSNMAFEKMVIGHISKSDRVFYNRKYIHHNLRNMLHYSTFKGGLQELLRYADRNSMANSIEVRLPYLSHELVEFVFSLPDNFKFKSGFTKFILRKGMEDILPSEICWRKDKIGYETPFINVKGKPLEMYYLFNLLN